MSNRRRRGWSGIGVLLVAITAGCEPGDESEPGAAIVEERQILDFPTELHADDQSVNAFVREVIETCASGDYEAFRLLWSIRDDPFPRDQFYRAWQSVHKVEVTGMRKMRNPADQGIVYAVAARVDLDPGVREPQRRVVILLIKEKDAWRLTRPPEGLAEELFESRPATSQPTSAPGAGGAP